MSNILPLELQRKYDKRWAARFIKPESTAPQAEVKDREQLPASQSNS